MIQINPHTNRSNIYCYYKKWGGSEHHAELEDGFVYVKILGVFPSDSNRDRQETSLKGKVYRFDPMDFRNAKALNQTITSIFEQTDLDYRIISKIKSDQIFF